jgi:hypothetical protein
MLSMYSSPVIGRADVLVVVSGVEIGPAAIFAVSRNAAFGVIEISAWFAKAHRSMLRTNLGRRRLTS